MNKNWLSLLIIPVTLACGLVAQPLAIDVVLEAEHRSVEDKQRDIHRHPKETLAFFGLQQDQHVLEIWPGAGWYSDILAPYLKDQGRYTAATFSPNEWNSDDKREVFWSKISRRYIDKFSDQSLYGEVNFTIFEDNSFTGDYVPENVDLVLLVRSIHIWDERGSLLDSLKAVLSVMKPGATLGIVQHRAKSLSATSSSAAEGYMDEGYVIEAAERAGFKFVASSEINQNKKDTKDYLRGVYSLPPTLAMGNVDKDKYLAIGESDRMTLKFVKPTND